MPLQSVLKLIPTARALRVRLSVLNPSNQYEMFPRMSCSWEDNWRCDKPGITLAGHACLSNMGKIIILPPRSAHHEAEWWLLFGKLKPGRATFRLGLVRQRSDFTSEELEHIYRSGTQNQVFYRSDIGTRFKREQEVFWSNRVVAQLRPEWLGR